MRSPSVAYSPSCVFICSASSCPGLMRSSITLSAPLQYSTSLPSGLRATTAFGAIWLRTMLSSISFSLPLSHNRIGSDKPSSTAVPSSCTVN